MRARRLLGPHEIEDGWFELHLPSLQLRVLDRIPDGLRERAEYVLVGLRLRDDERAMRQRREWHRMYQDGELSQSGLGGKAPLIATAVARESIAWSSVNTGEEEQFCGDQSNVWTAIVYPNLRLRMPVPINAINLDRRPGRWEAVTGNLGRLGLRPTRITAVDGQTASRDELKEWVATDAPFLPISVRTPI